MLSGGAQAQQQQIPSSAEPGRFDERFQQPQRPPVSPGAVPSTAPQPAQPVPPQAASMQLTLSQVRLQGNSVLSQEELSGAWSEHMGQRIPLSTVYEIARAITARYRNRGYILSQAIVPPQKMENGVVTIQVVEGYVSDLRIEGEIEGNEELLKNYGRKIQEARPIQAATLERYLLLMDDLPGVSARGILRPSPNRPGASTLVVTLDHDIVDGAFSANNRGSDLIGQEQIQVMADINSALGMYERTELRGAVATDVEELQYFSAAQEYTIGEEGTTVKGFFERANSEPGKELRDLEVESQGIEGAIEVSHPFIRSRGENLFVTADFRANNYRTTLLNNEFYNDQIRSVGLEVAYDVVDSYTGINLIDFEVRQGVDILGATSDGNNRSRINGEHDFTKFRLGLSRTQPLGGGFTWMAAARGQYSLDPLLASEEFGLGGERFGSAYDPSELTGDHGAAMRTELQYGQSFENRYLTALQLYGFYDLGSVWEKDRIAGEEARESLASTGGGMRFNMFDEFSGSTEIAVPLTREVALEGPSSKREPRFFFNISSRF